LDRYKQSLRGADHRIFLSLAVFNACVKSFNTLRVFVSYRVSSFLEDTRPADYIYEFLGLLDTEDKTLVRVDYSLPYWHVYREVFKGLFDMASQRGVVYQLLSTFSFYNAESQVFPSWVPDLSNQGYTTSFRGHGLYSEKHFRPTKEQSWVNDGDILMAQGVHLDVVYHVNALPKWNSSSVINSSVWFAPLTDLMRAVQTSANSLPEVVVLVPLQIVEASNNCQFYRLLYGNNPPDDDLEGL
jgi:hypothetical protein